MRKLFLFCIFCCAAPLIFGMEIFVHSGNNNTGSLCQAVQIADTWFMTAAHCVVPYCASSSCEVEIPTGKVTGKDVHWLNKAQTNKTYYDIAVINFKGVQGLPSGNYPSIVIVKDNDITEPKTLNKSLSVSYSGGVGEGKINSFGPLFYGPKNKIIYTKEFGLIHGVSGAGVFSGYNELISVVSGIAGQDSNAEFSVFSVFDEEVKRFLNSNNIPGLRFTYLDKKDFSSVTEQYKEKVYSLDNN